MFLFFPVVVPIVLLILKRLLIKLVKLFPEILVQVIQAEVLPFFKDVEQPFLENLYSSLDMVLVSWVFDLRGEDSCPIVLCLFRIVFVDLRIDPVLVGDHCLLAVIRNNDCRDASEEIQSVIVNADPLRLLR